MMKNINYILITFLLLSLSVWMKQNGYMSLSFIPFLSAAACFCFLLRDAWNDMKDSWNEHDADYL